MRAACASADAVVVGSKLESLSSRWPSHSCSHGTCTPAGSRPTPRLPSGSGDGRSGWARTVTPIRNGRGPPRPTPASSAVDGPGREPSGSPATGPQQEGSGDWRHESPLEGPLRSSTHRARRARGVRGRHRGCGPIPHEAPRVHLPYLHTVPPHEEDSFRRLLTELRRDHTFISYSEAVERILTGDVDRPYLAFSFDDGFESNVRTARILEEFDTVGCFFVATRFIGTPTCPGCTCLVRLLPGHRRTGDDLGRPRRSPAAWTRGRQPHRAPTTVPSCPGRRRGGDRAADDLRARLGSHSLRLAVRSVLPLLGGPPPRLFTRVTELRLCRARQPRRGPGPPVIYACAATV